MKLLAIHSNILFFGQAPNFYEWLAGEREMIEKYKPLREKYNQEKVKGPLLLKDTYERVVGGLSLEQLKQYCQQYYQEYFKEEAIRKLSQIMRKVLVLVFSSYPRELYEIVKDKGLVHKVFGVEGSIGTDGKIVSITELRLEHERAVQEKMKEIGLSDKFTLKPNRFGMLEYLIDEMIENNLAKDDVTVVGGGDTAKPMYKVAVRVIENLSEI